MTTPYYQDDLVTLYHGDCLEVTDWLTADVLVTDPPYGIRWSGVANYARGERQDRRTQGNEMPIANDGDLTVRDEVLAAWGDRPAMVFGTWRRERPRGTRHRLVWWKRGQAPGPTRSPFVLQDEEIYVIGGGRPRADSPLRSVLSTEESRSRIVSEVGHPTPKPVGLMETLIERCPEGTVADPFAGSGATLLAARNLGRRVIGVELEERYCEVIVRRLSQQAFDFSALEPITPEVRSSGWPHHDDETGLFKEWAS